MRMKENQKSIENYQGMIYNQQKTIQTIDNAAFVEEMQTIMQKTERALADCASYVCWTFYDFLGMLMRLPT